MAKFTRRQLATYAAGRLVANDKGVIEQLASYLYQNGRTKETDMLVRDIEEALQSRGVVSANIVSAHGLDDTSREQISRFLTEHFNTTNVQIDEEIDTTLLGGIKIRSAGNEFDGSLKRKINLLKRFEV